MIGIVRQIPGCEQDRCVGGFSGARRHEYSQPINVAAGDGLELVDQQPMMAGWLESGKAAELS
jgi:hypothetical protein